MGEKEYFFSALYCMITKKDAKKTSAPISGVCKNQNCLIIFSYGAKNIDDNVQAKNNQY